MEKAQQKLDFFDSLWLPNRGANFLAGRARGQWRTGLVYNPGLLGSAR